MRARRILAGAVALAAAAVLGVATPAAAWPGLYHLGSSILFTT